MCHICYKCQCSVHVHMCGDNTFYRNYNFLKVQCSLAVLIVPWKIAIKQITGGDDCCVCSLLFRIKQLNCFSACHYQIGNRAYYRLKPEDHVVGLGQNIKCDRPSVLHTFLHRNGLLLGNGQYEPNKLNKEKSSQVAYSAVSNCSGVVASNAVSDSCKVIFLYLF